jgi:hypothetical protein
MFENLSQENFEHILDVLILYKQVNPKKVVCLNEKCVKEAFHFMNTTGQQFASQLGMKNKNDDNDDN